MSAQAADEEEADAGDTLTTEVQFTAARDEELFRYMRCAKSRYRAAAIRRLMHYGLAVAMLDPAKLLGGTPPKTAAPRSTGLEVQPAPASKRTRADAAKAEKPATGQAKAVYQMDMLDSVALDLG